MNSLREWAMVPALIGLMLVPPVSTQAVAAAPGPPADHVLTAELVITDAVGNQFRLVRHGGPFTAPAGTSLKALDRQPVRVEFGSDGTVLRISRIPIRIEPIAHRFDAVSGELVLRDPTTRTIAIAGDDATYAAPSGINLGEYAGRAVKMWVDERGHVTSIEPLVHSATVSSPAPHHCTISDASIADGLAICRHGLTFRCSNGRWVGTGATCS